MLDGVSHDHAVLCSVADSWAQLDKSRRVIFVARENFLKRSENEWAVLYMSSWTLAEVKEACDHPDLFEKVGHKIVDAPQEGEFTFVSFFHLLFYSQIPPPPSPPLINSFYFRREGSG